MHIFGIERSEVKVTGSITLHSDTSNYNRASHSLGGDTDKSNTTWVGNV